MIDRQSAGLYPSKNTTLVDEQHNKHHIEWQSLLESG